MAANKAIYDKIADYDRKLAEIIPTQDPAIPELMNVWEWNDVTNLPIFDDTHEEWERFVFSYCSESSVAKTPHGKQFIGGMRDNLQEFSVTIPSHDRKHKKNALLRNILMSDFKKIVVTDESTGIRVRKTNAVLLPFPQPVPVLRSTLENPADPARSIDKPIEELIQDINWNSARGYYGSGTYWCRHAICTVTGPTITNSPVVQWGPQPGQCANLWKRFTCCDNNVIYLIHCEACIRENNWTTYIGQTNKTDRNVHDRLAGHMHLLSRFALKQYYKPHRSKDFENRVMGILGPNSDVDTEGLLRDPYSHFKYVHSWEDRRITLLNGGFSNQTTRERYEFIYMKEFGNFQYIHDTKSGSLNWII